MRISHVNSIGYTNFIEVRQYKSGIVNVSQLLKPCNSEFCTGFWKVKYIDRIPMEYKYDYIFLKKEQIN